MDAKSRLRRDMRARRHALSLAEKHLAAQSLYRTLRRHPLFLRATSIAGYFPVSGELDPTPLLIHASRLGKTTYLPVLDQAALQFAPYRPGRTALRRNRYGIPEPRSPQHLHVHAEALDVILLPLVAFDAWGNRLGMGGGYYDRTLSFKRRRRIAARPFLLGVGYEFQEATAIAADPWDVPLNGIITERRLLLARHAGRP